MQHYIIIPASWITNSVIEAIKAGGNTREFIPIFADDETPTTYFIAKIADIYDDRLVGFKKFTRDQVEFVIANILDGVEIIEDFYLGKN